MRDLSTVEYFSTAETLVDVICKKTQSNSPLFFRVVIGYYLCKVASMMRCNIQTHDRGKIPVNAYVIALGTSGVGKGHSTNIMEEKVIHLFKEVYLESTFLLESETNLAKLAVKRANKKGTDPDTEIEKITKEFESLGELAFSFDSGTTAAVKQMRHKLLMANTGSMNMEIDEIGSNLLGNMDVLTTGLELFDVGKVKQKLTKNTSDNVRSEEIDGRTPTNLLLFGTPSKLLDGGKVEQEFDAMLEAGYARRCLFGTAGKNIKDLELTPEEIYDSLTDTDLEDELEKVALQLGNLANSSNLNVTLSMSKDVSLLCIEYKLSCEKQAAAFPEHREVEKAEISHRYFKAIKLAGAYAFISGNSEITEDTMYSALRLVEDSGKAFKGMLTRERNYVKLARYIANVDTEVTHVDIVEDLPFYKGSESNKREMLNYAIAYGYKNNIIIKRIFNDGIEFLKGESLQETDLDKIVISHSNHYSESYVPETAPFDKIEKLTQMSNRHWASHHFKGNYREEVKAIPGFNLIVIDIDESVSIASAEYLLKDYTYHIHTTKRHTEANNRFRILLPMSHYLKLDAEDFKEFMNNVYEWLPFEVDAQTNQRSRKWETFDGTFFNNSGKLIDTLSFIPKTDKNIKRKQVILDTQSLSALERWFINNSGEGNRNNQLLKYTLMLVDSGQSIETVTNNVLALNNKLAGKMEEAEVRSTILVTAAKAVIKRDM